MDSTIMSKKMYSEYNANSSVAVSQLIKGFIERIIDEVFVI